MVKTNQTFNLTEPQANLVRSLLEQEHDRLAKEMFTALTNKLKAEEQGLPEAAAFESQQEYYTTQIRKVTAVLEKF